MASDILSLWREEGAQRIQKNYEEFRDLLAQTNLYLQRGEYETAAAFAEVAALHAVRKHNGLFASFELEQILFAIAEKTIYHTPYPKHFPSFETPQSILHISTSVGSIGGHSRNLWRWIRQDESRSHSVALTQQAPIPIPELLQNEVAKSCGSIFVLNETTNSPIQRAQQLRDIASAFDLVVLHVHNDDVIPMLAFANKEQTPPIVLLDHADHLFWLGAGVSDVVAGMREAGIRLAQERRGIAPERSALLPIILEPKQRVLSRAEAKQQIGIPEDRILLLSIARAIKYKALDGVTFADAHVSLLKQHPQATLVIVGPGDSEDWSAAISQTKGRIKVIGETENTALFYQAADIYVDSFPFPSNTSLLEAGCYGLPLVSRYLYSSEVCDIFGAGAPGLTGSMIQVRTLEEYIAALSRLIEDEELRLTLGEATIRSITEKHLKDDWQSLLENVYAAAINLPRVSPSSEPVDKIFIGEPDVYVERIDGWGFDLAAAIKKYKQYVPFNHRLRIWFQQSQKNKWQVKKNNGWGHISLLLPDFFLHSY
ncbi:MAG: glycosyltransferase family 4 protein [Leptodesmis sp.]|uniref:glycosyltransferase family 4 protein n=1 Tax=Leptodesmis sp. TaxID=3100501 RepID=UPI003D0E3DF0